MQLQNYDQYLFLLAIIYHCFHYIMINTSISFIYHEWSTSLYRLLFARKKSKVKTPAININITKMAINEQEYWFMRSWQSNREEHEWSVHSSISVKEVYSHIKDSEFDCKIVKIITNFMTRHNTCNLALHIC